MDNDIIETIELVEEASYNPEETPDIIEETSVAEDAEQSSPENATIKELEALREQVGELTQLLAKKQAESERIAKQLGDFYELFPDTAVDALPDEVWEDVKRGNSLAAAYAIYNRKLSIKAEQIKKINQKDASLSAGKAGKDAASEYYTPDEVRAMSREQVRANYQKIISSMKKWN